jgi:hypothetical protein
MMGDGVMPKKEDKEVIVDRRDLDKSVGTHPVAQTQIRFGGFVNTSILPLLFLDGNKWRLSIVAIH